MFNRLRHAWRNLLHRDVVEQDLTDEIDAVFGLLVNEKIRSGMSPADARRSARLQLGGTESIREQVRDVRAGAIVSGMAQDVRHGTRLLFRNPLFAAVAILSLGVGIGGNTAIFSLVNALMLRELAVANPGQLVEFGRVTAFGRGGSFSYPIYEQLRDTTSSFAGVAAMSTTTMQPADEGLVPATGRMVSTNFFEVLGVSAHAGRLLSASDDAGDRATTTVISYGWWQRAFGGGPDAIGRTFRVDAVPFTIVGVLPQGFGDPAVGRPSDFFVPMASEPQLRRNSWLDRPDFNWMAIIGRLKADDLPHAQADVATVFAQFLQTMAPRAPDAGARDRLLSQRIVLESARTGFSQARRQFSTPVLLLMGAVGLVLLIACANVVNLLLARGVSRQREIALRSAVGASASRLIRQLLTETAILGLIGGALGLGLASWVSPLIVRLASQGGTPLELDVAPDPRILLFTATIAIGSAVLAGIVPALRTARTDAVGALKADARTLSTTRSSTRWGRALIAIQVALSLLLLVGASLVVVTIRNMRVFDPGFDRRHVLLQTVDPIRAGYRDDALTAYYRDVLDRVRSAPGIKAASLSAIVPISGAGIDLSFEAVDRPDIPVTPVKVHRVSDSFFSTLGMRLRAGRDFDALTVSAPASAIVSESLARRYYSGRSPIGARVRLGPLKSLEIIGVVSDAKYASLRDPDEPTVYVNAMQPGENLALALLVRTEGEPLAADSIVRQAVQAAGPTVRLAPASTLDAQVERSLAMERLVSRLLSAFALMALFLSAVGLYGVFGYAVARRTGEIGVRLALGASRGAVLRGILREAWVIVAIGTALGVPAVMFLSRLLGTLLFGVTPWNPAVLAAVVTAMFIVASLAALVPAWRASRLDPLVALRHD